MRCRQGHATRGKWFLVVTINIYCFHTFKNIRECYRGNASKSVDRCSIAIVSRDLSRLRTSHAIMLYRKELAVNACMGTEIRLFYIVAIGRPERHMRKASHRGSEQPQRSPEEITLLFLVCATCIRCCSSRTSRSWWTAHLVQRQRRSCNSIYRLKCIPQFHTLVWCDQFLWTQQKPNDVIYNGDASWFDSFQCNSVK